ncbi:septum formation initiator [Actinomycetospora sp. NBRC 106375]|nr:septum formation initiator [Actinomycetospora sp. NBRC 106375]
MAARTAVGGADARRVVVMTDDEELLDETVRLAAAADAELERVPDAAGVRRRWHTAALVLLDEDAARAIGPLRLGRRDGVVVVCRGEPPGSLWERAVAVGAEHVVSLPDGEAWLVRALADARPAGDGGHGRVVAVVGGRGGAGASVLAVAIACQARTRGTRVLLVDCDPLGGGLDLVAGAEDLEGFRWGGLVLGGGGGGRVAAESLHEALPSPDGMLTVLSCDRAGAGPEPDAAVAVVEAGRRAGEIVVCDLPRHPTDTALAVADVADLVVMVVPAEVRAVAAAGRVAEPLVERGASLRVVVRGPAPGGLDAEDVEHALGLDTVVSVAAEPGLAVLLDRGQIPGLRRGPLQDAAAAVLDALDTAADRGRAA